VVITVTATVCNAWRGGAHFMCGIQVGGSGRIGSAGAVPSRDFTLNTIARPPAPNCFHHVGQLLPCICVGVLVLLAGVAFCID
jgi:hypothetical protein